MAAVSASGRMAEIEDMKHEWDRQAFLEEEREEEARLLSDPHGDEDPAEVDGEWWDAEEEQGDLF